MKEIPLFFENPLVALRSLLISIYKPFEIPLTGPNLNPTSSYENIPPSPDPCCWVNWPNALRRSRAVRSVTKTLLSRNLPKFASFLDTNDGQCMLHYSLLSRVTLFEAVLFRLPDLLLVGYEAAARGAKRRQQEFWEKTGLAQSSDEQHRSYETTSFVKALVSDCFVMAGKEVLASPSVGSGTQIPEYVPGFWEKALRLMVSSPFFNPNTLVNSCCWCRLLVAEDGGRPEKPYLLEDFEHKRDSFETVAVLLRDIEEEMRSQTRGMVVNTIRLRVAHEYHRLLLLLISHPNLNWDQQYALNMTINESKFDGSLSKKFIAQSLLTGLFARDFMWDQSLSGEQEKPFVVSILERFGDAFGWQTGLSSMSASSRKLRFALQRQFEKPESFRQFFKTYRSRMRCRKLVSTTLLSLSRCLPTEIVQHGIFPFLGGFRAENDEILWKHIGPLRENRARLLRQRSYISPAQWKRPEYLQSDISESENDLWFLQALQNRPRSLDRQPFAFADFENPTMRGIRVVRDYFDPVLPCVRVGEMLDVLGECIGDDRIRLDSRGGGDRWLVVEKGTTEEDEEKDDVVEAPTTSPLRSS